MLPNNKWKQKISSILINERVNPASELVMYAPWAMHRKWLKNKTSTKNCLCLCFICVNDCTYHYKHIEWLKDPCLVNSFVPNCRSVTVSWFIFYTVPEEANAIQESCSNPIFVNTIQFRMILFWRYSSVHHTYIHGGGGDADVQSLLYLHVCSVYS